MKFPVGNGDLLTGERLTLRWGRFQKIRGIRPEEDTPDERPETAGSPVNRLSGTR
jgi:hypothetical protein